MRLCCRRRLLCRGRAPREDPAAGEGGGGGGGAQSVGSRAIIAAPQNCAELRACSRCSSRSVAWRRTPPERKPRATGAYDWAPHPWSSANSSAGASSDQYEAAVITPPDTPSIKSRTRRYCSSFSPSILMMTAAEPSAVMNQPNDVPSSASSTGCHVFARSTSDACSQEAAPPRRRSGASPASHVRAGAARAAARRRACRRATPPVAEWTLSARKRRSRDFDGRDEIATSSPQRHANNPRGAARGGGARAPRAADGRAGPRLPAAARPRHRCRVADLSHARRR